MVKTRKRDFGMLVAAIAIFIAGILALQTGAAGWFETVEITGAQARLFGWASLIFSIALLVVYVRGRKQS